MSALPETVIPPTDVASREWLRSLRADGATRNEAVERLHALLLRAAVARRRAAEYRPHVRDELEEIAHEAAGDALINLLARLDDFRGESRFTTWAYKFALLETAVKLRKRAWQGRELPLAPEAWDLFSSVTFPPDAAVEQRELLSVLRAAVADVLTPINAKCLSAWSSTVCRSTSWLTVLIRRGGHFTRPCTMLVGSCASTSKAGSYLA